MKHLPEAEYRRRKKKRKAIRSMMHPGNEPEILKRKNLKKRKKALEDKSF